MSEERFLSGKSILVVEDIMLIALDLAGMVEDLGAETIGPASNVADALELIRTEQVDGALLDINLAGEPAYPIAQELQRRGVPFIFITGYDASGLPPEYASFPSVTKPFEYGEVNDLLRSVFAERRPVDHAAY